MSTLQLYALSFLIAFSYARDTCIFDDMSLSTEYQLHLSWFPQNSIILEAFDKERIFQYFYSPCADDTQCGSSLDSVGQVEQSAHNNDCYIVSTFDSSVQPIYNSSTQTWKFYYDNGWSFDCAQNRAISIYWHCNMSTNGFISSIHEIDGSPSCVYEMHIESKWSCLGQIPPQIEGPQFWEDPKFIMFAVVIGAIFGCIFLLILSCCLYKRLQRRKKIRNLIQAILHESGDYGARDEDVDTDIDLNDNVTDDTIDKLRKHLNQNDNHRYYNTDMNGLTAAMQSATHNSEKMTKSMYE